MRSTCLGYGSSLGSNPRVGDLGSLAAVERVIAKFPVVEHVTSYRKIPHDIPKWNGNHAGNFIPTSGNSGYTGYRTRFARENHFDWT
jgi:hypothetical protein